MKKILCFITTLLLAVSLPMTVLADSEPKRVVDDANLLSDSEEKTLSDKIDAIIKEYNCDVVIVTNTTLEGKSSETYADDFFDANGYGIGSAYSGILYLFSTEFNDYAISTSGYGNKAFTNYGLEYIRDQVNPILKEKDYFKAFDKYVDLTKDFLAEAKNGTPYDTNNKIKGFMDYLIYEGIALGIALVLALIVVLIMKAKMNTAIKRTTAGEYVRDGSMNLMEKRDVYMYSNVSKVKIQKSSSSGGGSSTHTSSSGRSHGGISGRL